MEFASLDPIMLLAMMAAGGLFALAGLWLMFRPMHGGGSTKIKVLGMEFESSSAGLLVFVIGAAFLASPLFVEKRPSAPIARSTPEERADVGKASPENGEVGTSSPEVAIVPKSSPRIFDAVGQEVEANNNIAAANEIKVGSVIHGEVQSGDPDFFSFALPSGFFGVVNVNVDGDVRLSVYNELGGRMEDRATRYSPSYAFRPEQTRYYVAVYTGERHAGYTLTVASRAE